jgi:trans-2-enoyl-CoA reductase
LVEQKIILKLLHFTIASLAAIGGKAYVSVTKLWLHKQVQLFLLYHCIFHFCTKIMKEEGIHEGCIADSTPYAAIVYWKRSVDDKGRILYR